MSLDLTKVKQRLEALKATSTKNQYLWKPSPGKQIIRIVPYAHQPENPFVELLFHYNMNNKTYLSPASFGRPDPIVEFSTKLKKSGDKEEWKTGRKLEPKLRTYVPILVRGAETEGVKFWGMGKEVYQEILGIIADPDYGDITDLKNGRDLVVEFKTAEETGKSFPKTSVRAKPNQTPAFDPTNEEVLKKVKNQKVITELFPELSYEELAAVMDTWLNASDTAETDPVAVTEEAGDDAAEAAPKSVTETKAAIKSPASTKEVADEFENLFNKS